MARVRDLSGNAPVPAPGFDDHLPHEATVRKTFPIVASDTVDIPQGVTDSLNVTTAGAYKVTYENGTDDIINLAAGIFHPVNVKRVWATGSVATAGIVGGY